MAYDKNEYNKQYKKDNFDRFSFFAPKGTKDKVNKRAEELGMTLAEYFRHLIEQDTQKDLGVFSVISH